MKTTFTFFRATFLALALTAFATLSAYAGIVSSGERSAAPVAEAGESDPNDAVLTREDEQMMSSPDIRRSFPRLNKSNFEIVGHHTKNFNCIAWSMGLDYWVNPETGDEANPFAKMDAMYAKLGYTRIDDMNTAVEPGIEKVALFATVNLDASIKDVTHAAKQEADGTWTSKLGQLPIIKHDTLDALRGPIYGTPVAIYVRPAKQTKSPARLSPSTRGGTTARSTKAPSRAGTSTSPFRKDARGVSGKSSGKELILAL